MKGSFGVVALIPLHKDDAGLKVLQMSAGVDMSMAVTTNGDVYSWGKCDGGRIGLGIRSRVVNKPEKVSVASTAGAPLKALDVECGYVHSLVVAVDGTIHLCGGVGTDGAADGQAVTADTKVGKSSKNRNESKFALMMTASRCFRNACTSRRLQYLAPHSRAKGGGDKD